VLAKALLEKEILNSDEIDKVLGIRTNKKTVTKKKRNNEKRKQKGN